MTTARRVVVAGGGLAGLRTVTALREQGYDGALTLLAAERHRPYDRPPLSKAVLTGETDDVTLEADWSALEVDLRLGCPATGLTGDAVLTAAGPVAFDALVVATGARPVTLPGTHPATLPDTLPDTQPGAGTGTAGVRTLRTVEDALALRAVLRAGVSVLIVGAGWIAAEVATAAARAGAKVTVVEATDRPLAGALPPEVGRHVASWYAAAGVDLRLGTRVEAVVPGAVELVGGERIAADCVLVGIGVRPDTGWLANSGVERDGRGAVLVDAGLRTSVPGVFAVGDCAAWPSTRFGARLLVEHWSNALAAPAVVAANLLGGDEAYDEVPYFWSEQFGRMVQYAGHHPAADETVWRGDPTGESWTVCWLRDSRLVAVLTVDRPRDLAQGRRLIAAGRALDRARVADPAMPLKSA